MGMDRRGLEMTGSAEAVAAYDRAIDRLIRFQPEVVDEIARAVAADPGCALASVFNAYLALMSTEEGSVAAAHRTPPSPSRGSSRAPDPDAAVVRRAALRRWGEPARGAPEAWRCQS